MSPLELLLFWLVSTTCSLETATLALTLEQQVFTSQAPAPPPPEPTDAQGSTESSDEADAPVARAVATRSNTISNGF